MSTPAAPITNATQQVNDSQQQDDSNLPDDDATAGSVNLHRSFSKLNDALTTLADEAGVKRSATVPHVDGEDMSAHLAAVNSTLQNAGGLTANLLTSSHSKHGKGVTIAFPASKLRETIIVKDDPNAIAAIDACKSFVNKCASLIGDDDPAVKTAKALLDIVGKQNAAGMNLADLLVALIGIPSGVIAAVARKHNDTKSAGPNHPTLKAPRQ